METISRTSTSQSEANASGKTTRAELHRPQYHFTPGKHWMNDPNGLIMFNGVYHLYYQYNPHGNQWGHMSWGHATSSDLVHWEEQAVAISEKEYMIFSGTTALASDKQTLIAAFTSFDHGLNAKGELIAKAQHQSIAKSNDGGYSYQEIATNPVLDIGSREFRDPKLFFDDKTQKWNMLVSLSTERKIAFYHSEDLEKWEKVSEFGPLGNIDMVWECPDFFELQLHDNTTTKWILTVSAGHPQNGYLGVQYFIGDFDGTRFVPDKLPYPLYLDHGKDFYAGITFANTGRKNYATMMAWVGSHIYSADTPTDVWKGAMSLPRDLFLTATKGGYRLQSKPPHSYLASLYEKPWGRKGLQLYNGMVEPPFKSKSFMARLLLKNKGSGTAGIKFHRSEECETVVGVDFANNEVFLDRTKGATKIFDPKFPGKDFVPTDASWQTLQIDLFVDHSVVEVFVQKGKYCITNLVFPDENCNTIKLFSEGGMTFFEEFEIRNIKSIWK
ncbi:MAG: glycoside hydrolase family 32 protein [Bacteroidota bacterium]